MREVKGVRDCTPIKGVLSSINKYFLMCARISHFVLFLCCCFFCFFLLRFLTTQRTESTQWIIKLEPHEFCTRYQTALISTCFNTISSRCVHKAHITFIYQHEPHEFYTRYRMTPTSKSIWCVLKLHSLLNEEQIIGYLYKHVITNSTHAFKRHLKAHDKA